MKALFPARATLDARCFCIGFYLIGKVKEQMRVSEGNLPIGAKPVRVVAHESIVVGQAIRNMSKQVEGD